MHFHCYILITLQQYVNLLNVLPWLLVHWNASHILLIFLLIRGTLLHCPITQQCLYILDLNWLLECQFLFLFLPIGVYADIFRINLLVTSRVLRCWCVVYWGIGSVLQIESIIIDLHSMTILSRILLIMSLFLINWVIPGFILLLEELLKCQILTGLTSSLLLIRCICPFPNCWTLQIMVFGCVGLL